MKIQIKHKITEKILLEGEAESIKGLINKNSNEILDLREADLRWANLRGADLRGADLREADLRWANLRGANLRWADLRCADLSEANLSEADLRWADLKEVKGTFMFNWGVKLKVVGDKKE
jgi:uncharacterized protein YjbI with pentapeptide repeats